MKDKNKKKRIIITMMMIVIFIAVVIGIIFTSKNKVEVKFDEKVLNLSVEFYTNYYYKQLSYAYENGELVNFLKQYNELGIKIDLDSIKEYSSLNNQYLLLSENKNLEENCNLKNTYVIFYPKEPYGITDYTTEVVLDCKKIYK